MQFKLVFFFAKVVNNFNDICYWKQVSVKRKWKVRAKWNKGFFSEINGTYIKVILEQLVIIQKQNEGLAHHAFELSQRQSNLHAFLTYFF